MMHNGTQIILDGLYDSQDEVYGVNSLVKYAGNFWCCDIVLL